MISAEKLAQNFYPVDELGDGVIRCGDELPTTTIYTYFLLCPGKAETSFVVSDNLVDDNFAGAVLKNCNCTSVSELQKKTIPQNSYGFTHVLHVPHRYHSELKGRLDVEREQATLCIPIFNSEFSGHESSEEFIDLRNNIVPTSRWDRQITPKISLRFENGKTNGGTYNNYIHAKFDQVLQEINNLSGVRDGFIEIINYKDDVLELLSADGSNFSWIRGRDDSSSDNVPLHLIQDRLWNFLTE